MWIRVVIGSKADQRMRAFPGLRPNHEGVLISIWYPGEDSNLHTSRYRLLRPARLPIPPPGQDDSDGTKVVQPLSKSNLSFLEILGFFHKFGNAAFELVLCDPGRGG